MDCDVESCEGFHPRNEEESNPEHDADAEEYFLRGLEGKQLRNRLKPKMRLWPALAGSFRASKQNAQLCACGRTGCFHVTDDAFLLDPSECLAAKAPATKCKFCSPLSSSTTAPDRRRGDTQKCRPHTSCTGSWLKSNRRSGLTATHSCVCDVYSQRQKGRGSNYEFK